MAWSWSHTQEAYDNACENVRSKDRKWLLEVYGEWHAMIGDDINSFDQEAYGKAIKKAEDDQLADDVLADYIWERMSESATCDNGGFHAWSCPSGCGCHTVSFDLEAE